MKEIIIVGAGGFGREIANFIQEDDEYLLKGFLDTRKNPLEEKMINAKIIGNPFHYKPNDNEFFIAAQGNPKDRKFFTEKLISEYNAEFINFLHKKSSISPYTKIGKGCIFLPYVAISSDTYIGDFTYIQEFSIIGHDVTIDGWCQIGSHCVISGGAKIGKNVKIHPNSVITPNAIIGDGVTVSPGSVVIGKIPPDITVIGNPARRFSF